MARRSPSKQSSKTLASVLTFIFLILAVLIAQQIGINVLETPEEEEGGAPTSQPQVGVETTASGNWYTLYFTEPLNTDDEQRHVGSKLEADLISAINNAQRTIDAALYELDLESVTQALIAAYNRPNVRVRLVMDDEDGVEDDTNTVNMLIDAGMVVYCGSEQPSEYDIRCDDRGALMHNKFFIIDGQMVWMGATNVTHNGVYNNSNNALMIRSQKLVQNYQAEFDEMFVDGIFNRSDDSGNMPNRQFTIDNTLVENYFSPEDGVMIENRVAELVSQATTSVDFMVNLLTLKSIGDAAIERFQNGVAVQGIFENRQSTQGQMTPMGCAGIPVKQDGNPSTFHHKVIIIDNAIVITGSFNYSASARDGNSENVLIIHSPEIAQQYTNEFNKWFNDARARTPSRAELGCR